MNILILEKFSKFNVITTYCTLNGLSSRGEGRKLGAHQNRVQQHQCGRDDLDASVGGRGEQPLMMRVCVGTHMHVYVRTYIHKLVSIFHLICIKALIYTKENFIIRFYKGHSRRQQGLIYKNLFCRSDNISVSPYPAGSPVVHIQAYPCTQLILTCPSRAGGIVQAYFQNAFLDFSYPC